MADELKGQSPTGAEETQASSQENQGEVKSTEGVVKQDEVIKYRSLQSKVDKTLSDKQKLELELQRAKSELVKKDIVHANPFLEPFVESMDFSTMTTEQINEGCEKLTNALESYRLSKQKSSAPVAQKTTEEKIEAPDIVPPQSSISNANSSLTPENFSKLSRKEMEKFLQSKGIL